MKRERVEIRSGEAECYFFHIGGRLEGVEIQVPTLEYPATPGGLSGGRPRLRVRAPARLNGPRPDHLLRDPG